MDDDYTNTFSPKHASMKTKTYDPFVTEYLPDYSFVFTVSALNRSR